MLVYVLMVAVFRRDFLEVNAEVISGMLLAWTPILIIGGAIFQTWGATILFVLGGLGLLVLLFIAVRKLKPGREDSLEPGLARGRPGH